MPWRTTDGKNVQSEVMSRAYFLSLRWYTKRPWLIEIPVFAPLLDCGLFSQLPFFSPISNTLIKLNITAI